MKDSLLKTLVMGIAAGILIAIGGSVFLACDIRYVGAILFAVALLCICYLGYYLFTGKIGYLVADHSGKNILMLAVGLISNLITTALLGLLIRYAIPNLGLTAETLCTGKLTQAPLQTLVRGIFCGILMYLAVEIFKEKKTPLGIIFCIPVFILSGFEHSIADMFYFGTAGIINTSSLLFIIIVVAGNGLGSCLLPLLSKISNKCK